MIKKVIAACLAAACMTISVNALEAPTINAKGAIIGEMKTGETVYELNADEKLYPASTTKIMTGILALEYGNTNDVITVSSDAVNGLSESGSSTLLKAGEQMNFMDMVTYLLVASGNDAANALAEHVSGSTAAFVDLMNSKAQELGCTNTHFANPNGLHDENHYTTARDLLKIAEYAMKNETFASLVKIDKITLPATNMRGTQTISTTNHLISRWRNRNYYYEGAIGIKTGSTTPAGLCLVSGIKSGDLTYITVVLGAGEAADGSLGSFTETIKLLDYAKNGFEVQPMVNSSDPVTEAPVSLGKDADSVVLIPENGFTALLPKGFNQADVTVSYAVNEDIKAPIEKGDILGKATYSYKGKEYTTVNLVASESIRRSTWFFIIDSVIGIFSSTFFKIAIGLIMLAIIAFLTYAMVNRRKRKRRNVYRSSYQSRRRR
ncbi:MAG: D-alanyl-D-alanine carboxypeptidase family protein [Clostridiaceae bacterium]|nr:D-alanyl-D-alanine carboxypeptidase family protein [Clostridiaceae bacterium]